MAYGNVGFSSLDCLVLLASQFFVSMRRIRCFDGAVCTLYDLLNCCDSKLRVETFLFVGDIRGEMSHRIIIIKN